MNIVPTDNRDCRDFLMALRIRFSDANWTQGIRQDFQKPAMVNVIIMARILNIALYTRKADRFFQAQVIWAVMQAQ